MITVADIQCLEWGAHFAIANEYLHKCDEQARHALLHDAHHGVPKAMSGNVVTAAATTAISSASDLCRVFAGHVSKAQLFKNVTNTAAGVSGGMAGASAGAAQGAIYLGWIPGGAVVGAAVGALVGSLVAGTAAAKIARSVTDLLIKDDAIEMMRYLERVFVEESQGFLLTQAEADRSWKRCALSEICADRCAKCTLP